MLSGFEDAAITFQSAPPVKGATLRDDIQPMTKKVSIRAPREGGDLTSNASGLTLPRFQSAPPVKGATLRLVSLRDVQRVSIRAPREGGDGDL